MRRPCKLLLLDLDGTVYEDGRPLPGVPETLARLENAGIPLRFLTNSTGKTRATIRTLLGGMGLAVAEEQIRTATLAARDFLIKRGCRRIRALLPEEVHEDLAPLEVLAPGQESEARPDAVLVGDLAERWSFELLNRAFRELQAGSLLVACQRNRYWKSEGRLQLDAGPFVKLLEEAAAVEATIVGKPSAEFFLGAVREALPGAAGAGALQEAEIYMVGDDLENDVLGARACGLQGVLVRSGKFREEDEARARSEGIPLLDSAAGLDRFLL